MQKSTVKTFLQSLEKIQYKQIEKCCVCGCLLSSESIKLPQLPLTEIYHSKFVSDNIAVCDQEFIFCDNCGHGQLKNQILPEILYNTRSYFFRTSKSKSAGAANDFFLNFIKEEIKGKKYDLIIEIGCSDIYLLRKLASLAKHLVGIDPILKGREKELAGNKIEVIGDYFENVDLSFVKKFKRILVITSHTLEHLQDPGNFLRKILSLAVKTDCVFQFPILDVLFGNGRYDQIFHQHLQYFTIDSFSRLIESLGGRIINSTINYDHWGTLLVSFAKSSPKKERRKKKKLKFYRENIEKSYREFQVRMKKIIQILEQLKNEELYGFGASNMLPILDYHLQYKLRMLKGIYDDDKTKSGLFFVNHPAPIIALNAGLDFFDKTIILTAVNTVRLVLPRILALHPKRLIIPVNII